MNEQQSAQEAIQSLTSAKLAVNPSWLTLTNGHFRAHVLQRGIEQDGQSEEAACCPPPDDAEKVLERGDVLLRRMRAEKRARELIRSDARFSVPDPTPSGGIEDTLKRGRAIRKRMRAELRVAEFIRSDPRYKSGGEPTAKSEQPPRDTPKCDGQSGAPPAHAGEVCEFCRQTCGGKCGGSHGPIREPFPFPYKR